MFESSKTLCKGSVVLIGAIELHALDSQHSVAGATVKTREAVSHLSTK